MKRRSISVEDRHDAIVRGIRRETANTEALPYLDSDAQIYRYIFDAGIRALVGEIDPDGMDEDAVDPADVGALVPRHVLADYKRERIKERGRQDILSGDVAGRFADHAESFFDGSFKPSVEHVERTAESFIDEVEMYAEHGYLDDEDAVRQANAIWDEVDRYREQVGAAEVAPDVREPPEEVRIGRGIQQLRDDGEAFLSAAKEMAETEHFSNPDALRTALASQFAVEVEVVDAVLEELTDDGVDPRSALKAMNHDELPGPEDLVDDLALDGDDVVDERVESAGEVAAGDDAVETVARDTRAAPMRVRVTSEGDD